MVGWWREGDEVGEGGGSGGSRDDVGKRVGGEMKR